MTGIAIVNTLELVTDVGKCQIQLCVGDITALPKEDEVDVLVISAFPGDYSPTPRSLIGQLSVRLGVSVRHLAKDKEEDLRKLYSCWWSKPLPDHLSFRKILCFEGRCFQAGNNVSQVVGDIFRCLVPVLANKEGKVIMPILASGDQRYSKRKMLKLLVNAAVHWMHAGLPMRCLKIVLFARDVTKISKADEPLIELFQTLKESHEKEMKEENFQVTKEASMYDIYLSYSMEDQNRISQVIDSLVENKSDVKVFSAIQEIDVEESWQQKLYSTITLCKRVVALITPSYLQSTRCTEQYNIALCHSRKERQGILVPLYISEVPYMPAYMKLTQYIDCRNNFSENLVVACVTVVRSLSTTPLSDNTGQDKGKGGSTSPENYDIFLSYSHCNEDQAKIVMKELRILQPDVNIFIDTAELKAGGAWQQILYHALDSSKIVIALISNDYLHSKVCNEELSLSITNQLQGNCKVCPLVIEPLREDIKWLRLLSPVNCFGESVLMTDVCREIVKDITELRSPPSFPGNKDIAPLASVLKESRSLFLNDDFASLFVASSPALGHTSHATSTFVICPKNTANSTDIYIIASAEDSNHCDLLKRLILSQNPSLVVRHSSNENNTFRLTLVDETRLVIPLLSSGLMESPELVHELNIAWCRQRNSPNLCFLAITLDHLPTKPTYAHILPCFFNCLDTRWTEVPAKAQLPDSGLVKIYATSNCPLKVLLCFLAAVDLVHQWIQGQKCVLIGLHDKFVNYLHVSTCIQRSKENDKEQTEMMAASDERYDSVELSAACQPENKEIPKPEEPSLKHNREEPKERTREFDNRQPYSVTAEDSNPQNEVIIETEKSPPKDDKEHKETIKSEEDTVLLSDSETKSEDKPDGNSNQQHVANYETKNNKSKRQIKNKKAGGTSSSACLVL